MPTQGLGFEGGSKGMCRIRAYERRKVAKKFTAEGSDEDDGACDVGEDTVKAVGEAQTNITSQQLHPTSC